LLTSGFREAIQTVQFLIGETSELFSGGGFEEEDHLFDVVLSSSYSNHIFVGMTKICELRSSTDFGIPKIPSVDPLCP